MNLPYIPGVDGAGVVTGVGTNVRHLQVGDRVAWQRVGSSYAEATAVAWQTTPTAVGGHDGKQSSLITHRIDRSDRGEAIPAS